MGFFTYFTTEKIYAMKKILVYITLVSFVLLIPMLGFSQKEKSKKDTIFTESLFKGLKFRNLGPAFMSGRIADIAINPEDESTWYIAVGSGGVWKTENAGITWKPIFDGQKSYSIGCISIDPGNPHVIWVGTGENIGGRHVGYGDGIYKSEDGGSTWKNMGLKESHHLSKIVIHPENPDVIWVAAQGPLWSKGGERGLYKSNDGGKTWTKKLGDDEWTGVTDILIDPRNPDRLYAATWQRHRNVAAYMSGGPGTAIYASTDGGETWKKLKKGLPGSNMGKIGLAISPQKPDVLYAAIELDRRSGAVYRSTDRGASWKKQSSAVSGATGPHYYQELYACPHEFDRIYLADVRIQVSDDGGRNFRRLDEQYKHSDNHAIAFKRSDPEYLLIGTDGGLYESFDLAKNWRYMANLPLTQYYKLAVDDAEPFYNIYGGTQDNGTQGGPSRTDNRHGIRNADWYIILSADGHQPATEPGNPDIVYAESQQGNLSRIDRTTGETISIKPQPGAGEDYERFNWDAPILVSPHSPTRLYFASQRVWRSDDRGDSWTAISGDLTLNQERITLPIMGKTQSWDSPWDIDAMSNYNTITSLAESPRQEGLIYAGTDDGIVQLTEDGGKTWTKIEVGSLPGVPATAFVNDIKADLYDAGTVYVVLDNHKFGDLDPYLLKSTDKGNTWKSIKGNLPDRTLVWRIVQDHVKPGLLFAATEFGIYFTIDGGEQWTKLSGNVPTISFRDLAIQKRENDLVGASFGRGFYVLDDYSILRDISREELSSGEKLFSPRKAWWYMKRPVISFGERGSQGGATYHAPNPPYGAVFTYYLAESRKTLKEKRKEREKKLTKEKKNIPFPGWDEVEKERREEKPGMILIVKNSDGEVVRKINGPATKGFHRVAWDLRMPSVSALDPDRLYSSYRSGGMLAAPGEYTVSLAESRGGNTVILSEAVPFEVVPLHKGALKGATPQEAAAFWREVEEIRKVTSSLSIVLREAQSRVSVMKKALSRTALPPGKLDSVLYQLNQDLYELDEKLYGNRSKSEVGEKSPPGINQRIGVAAWGSSNSTYGPTPTHRQSLEIAIDEFAEVKSSLEDILENRIPEAEQMLIDAGAPWIKGQAIPDLED